VITGAFTEDSLKHRLPELPDHTGSMEVASAQVEGGFNERLTALRKAAEFTLCLSSDGKLLAVSHTCAAIGTDGARVRII